MNSSIQFNFLQLNLFANIYKYPHVWASLFMWHIDQPFLISFSKVKITGLKNRDLLFLRGAPERTTEGRGFGFTCRNWRCRRASIPCRVTPETLDRMREQQRGCLCVKRRVCEPNPNPNAATPEAEPSPPPVPENQVRLPLSFPHWKGSRVHCQLPLGLSCWRLFNNFSCR